jgi:hypothetical protein
LFEIPKNPAEVNSGAKAALGQPIELALGGLGIRSIDRVGGEYLVIAGPSGESGGFALYKWSGAAGDAPIAMKKIDFKDMHPEALFAVPGTDMIQILSDDGGREVQGIKCKDLTEVEQMFRSITVKP